ncbi:MAG: antibiotic biosynthesis monooxygenase [Candidatus Eisenbacteria bacterium]|nr:antibiotic biosynthesis monooxygenase [Candidatus Eisenbacteria bacterium]
MPSTIVRFTVDYEIREGQSAEFERIAREMSVASEAEPGTLGYEWHLSPDGRRCRLLETFADGSAAHAHLSGRVVQEQVAKLLEVSAITGFEVYGDPGAAASSVLRELGAEVFVSWVGFRRIEP